MDPEIPYNWEPRPYQTPLWDAIANKGIKHACYCWHRRAGKDLFGLNFLIFSAYRTVGTYWHVFPTYKQGKRAIWQETTLDGVRYLDYIPADLITHKNEQEMKITFKNGSVYQIIGAEDPSSLRGSGIKGCILSEYSEQNPASRRVIQPMLLASDGWELINFTPKGKNDAYRLFEYGKTQADWYTEILTVNDTNVFNKDKLEKAKQELLSTGQTEDFFNQEYYCSFSGSLDGSYYGALISKLYEENRALTIPYEQDLKVNTAWDLGMADSTSIVFWQHFGNEIRIIDYYENSGESLQYYAQVLQQKGYIYGRHIAPHDIRVRELGSGKSRLETALKLGINFEICPNIPIADGINALRMIFHKLYFDKEKCSKLLDNLSQYKKLYDEKLQCFKDKPVHDYTSHSADAMRYFAIAVGYQEKEQSEQSGFAIMD